jgi:general secretion pathway protein F
MKTFAYRGLDRQGRARRGLVEALTVKEARERLAAAGVLAERVEAAGRTVRLRVGDRSTLYRELGALLGSLHLVLAGLKDRLREGVPLATALRQASDSVTPFETAILEAAERSASVDAVLERLADFLDEQQATTEKVQAALFYPGIVFTAGVCVAILMLGLLLPRVRTILAGGAEVPALTLFMERLGSVLYHWGPVLLALVALGLWRLRRRLRRDEEFRRRWDRVLFRLPLFGGGYRTLVSLRFARTLAMLLRSGVPLLDGLVLAGRATGSPWVAEMTRSEADAVRQGDTLAAALRRIPPLAAALPGWVHTGETSGGLERMLDGAARRFQGQWDRFVTRGLSALEPLLIFLIGGFVLLVALSVLLPVLTMTRTLLR